MGTESDLITRLVKTTMRAGQLQGSGKALFDERVRALEASEHVEKMLRSELAALTRAAGAARSVLARLNSLAEECDACKGTGVHLTTDDDCGYCGGVGEVCHAGPELHNLRNAWAGLAAALPLAGAAGEGEQP